MRPSDLRIPIGYPNNDPSNAAGMVQGDYGANNRVTFAVLVGLDTFSRCLPEFQRRYVAMMVACEVETGKSMGVGTAWRSEAQQAANHLRWPNQFAPVESSYHMRVPLTNTTLAADVVPGDVWPWMHANCHRFGFIHLTKNEQHHIQLVELPRSRSAYNQNPASHMAAVESRLLPYVGALSLAEFLARDEPLTADGPTPPSTDPPPHTDPPEPPPTPVPVPTPPVALAHHRNEDDMIFLARQDGGLFWWGYPGEKRHGPVDRKVIAVFLNTDNCYDVGDGRKLIGASSGDSISLVTDAQLDAIYG